LYTQAKQSLLLNSPDSVFRAQKVSEWTGTFDLPQPVADYYTELGPVDVHIPGYGNPYFLPSLASLWKFQAGYRYHPETSERFEGWDDEWLVIADEGGDAFIYSRNDTTISHAYHGEGVWSPKPLFASIEHMAACFSIMGEIAGSAGLDFTDSESFILPCYIEEAEARMTEITKDSSHTERVLTRLGWLHD
ncbi:MAG TPA: hypothetical protein DIT64_20880, partial [Verrucomicrobiales bacterium]|nr:hypothetical protein [Verrucomicrobiales bacterium]